MGRSFVVPKVPLRIVSLVPSQTELLYDLGLEDRVVGITKFCIHPEDWFRGKERVGGTKKLHLDRIAALNPDLIIGNKEENERSQIEELSASYPVWMSDIQDLEDAYNMMLRIGKLTQTGGKAQSMVRQLRIDFDDLSPSKTPQKVAYFIWRNPWMVAGHSTFINHLLKQCGWKNVFSDTDGRYPIAEAETIAAKQPDLVLLSSEPYPFKEQHIAELQHLCPQAKIALVDGELFSWYGSRLLHTSAYLQSLINTYS